MNYSDFWEHSPIQHPFPTGTNLHSPNTNSENTERQRGKREERGGREHTYITPHLKNILLQSSEYTSRHLKTYFDAIENDLDGKFDLTCSAILCYKQMAHA